MLRVLLLIAIGFLIYQLFKRSKPVTVFRKDSEGREIETRELVRDPICRTYVARERATEYHNEFFCSDKCLNQFKQAQGSD